MNSKTKLLLLALVVFIAMYIIFYNTPSGNSNDETNSYQSCQLVKGSCHFNIEGQSYRLELSPERPLPESEIAVSIAPSLLMDESRGEQQLKSTAIKATGFLSGKTMYMGKIPLFFSEQFQESESSKGKSVLVATTPIGACTEPEMVWQLTATITTAKQVQYTLITEFTVYQ